MSEYNFQSPGVLPEADQSAADARRDLEARSRNITNESQDILSALYERYPTSMHATFNAQVTAVCDYVSTLVGASRYVQHSVLLHPDAPDFITFVLLVAAGTLDILADRHFPLELRVPALVRMADAYYDLRLNQEFVPTMIRDVAMRYVTDTTTKA